jgi:hypothetical protein
LDGRGRKFGGGGDQVSRRAEAVRADGMQCFVGCNSLQSNVPAIEVRPSLIDIKARNGNRWISIGQSSTRRRAMEEHDVDVLPGEVCEWVREDAQLPVALLNVNVSKHYNFETDFDRQELGIADAEEVGLVTASGLLEMEPRSGGDGWTLQVRAEDAIGLTSVDDANGYQDEDDMTLDEFDAQFLQPMRGEVEVVVLTEADSAWDRFQNWLARQRGKGSRSGRRAAK